MGGGPLKHPYLQRVSGSRGVLASVGSFTRSKSACRESESEPTYLEGVKIGPFLLLSRKALETSITVVFISEVFSNVNPSFLSSTTFSL